MKLFVLVKIADYGILKMLVSKLPNTPRLSNLTDTPKNQWFSVIRLFPLEQFCFYISFHVFYLITKPFFIVYNLIGSLKMSNLFPAFPAVFLVICPAFPTVFSAILTAFPAVFSANLSAFPAVFSGIHPAFPAVFSDVCHAFSAVF